MAKAKKMLSLALAALVTVGSMGLAPASAATKKVDYYQIALTNINKYLKPQLTATKQSQSEEDLKLLQSYYRSLKIHMSKITDAKKKAAISKMLMEISQDIVAVTAQVKAQIVASDAVEAFELAAISTQEEIAAAEALYANALDKVQDIADRTVRMALMNRINDKKAKLDAAKKGFEDVAATLKAAEDAVKAYEDFQITKYEEVAKAKELAKAAADAVAKVVDADKKAALNTRIAEQDKKVAAKEAELMPVKVEEVKPVAVNKIEVKFNKAVDTAKAVVNVKKGSAIYYSTVAWSEDKKVATVTTYATLLEGEYTVEVTGLTETALTSAVKVEARKATTIEIKTDSVAKENGAKIAYVIKDQYGNDMNITSNVTAFAYNTTQNTSENLTAVQNKSEFEFSSFSQNAKIGDVIRVTLVYGDLTVTKNITLIEAPYPATITFGALTLPNNKARFEVSSQTTNTATLSFALKDQYGNDYKGSIADIEFKSSNESVVKITEINVQEGKITLEAGQTAGTASIIAIFKNKAGVVVSTPVTVYAAPTIKSVTIAPITGLVAANDKAFTLDLTAVDQYGAAVSNISSSVITVTSSDSNKATAQIIDNKNKLEITPKAAGTVTITLKNGNDTVGSITFTIEEAAYAARIVGIKNFNTVLEQGASVTFTKDNLQVVDQYNRPYALADATGITIEVKGTNSGNVTIEGLKFTAPQDKEGSQVFTVKLAGAQNSIDLTMETVKSSAIVSYELAPLGTIYASTETKYHKALSLTGKLADGRVVVLKDGKITAITSSNTAVATIANNMVQGVKAGTATIAAWSGATKLAETTVTVSEAAPVATKVEFKNLADEITVGEEGYDLKQNLKVYDQYGVEIDAEGFWTVSDTSVANINNGVITKVKAGKVVVGFVTKNGLVVTKEVEIK